MWDDVQGSRFRIPQILEFYAATEGNFSLFNAEGKPGAIGQVPSFLAHRFPVELIKVDIETGEPIRDDKGFCVRSAPNEPGHAIGRIAKAGSAAGGRFEGYTSEAETQKKVLRNVFTTGDAWFATGDLMRKDEHGYFYFVDRLGDTFRWKGENVATSEVAEAIAMFPSIADANVYGVAVPGTEGRAGMAAIVLKGAARSRVASKPPDERLLPPYARPLFLRVQQDA